MKKEASATQEIEVVFIYVDGLIHCIYVYVGVPLGKAARLLRNMAHNGLCLISGGERFFQVRAGVISSVCATFENYHVTIIYL